MCLVAAACADKLGYNYQPVARSNIGITGGYVGGNDGSAISGPLIGGDDGSLNRIGGIGGLVPNLSPGSIDAPVSYTPPAPAAELEKEFYTFTANENDFDEPQALDKVSNSLNKALRVVFIKGPENRGLENAALALAKQAAQQETAIYVLNKQADISDLANKLNAIRSNTNNKPEVHFVKYRTPEDAANAQRAIQGQYDQLGGSSKALDGGVAQVLNFASRGPERQVTAQSPDNSYLPTSIFRRLRR
ncbi:uncharacterized protein LOC111595792 [Drosophila hydei]|uniref:Uncharacterized protein LOC111595792 n=1 Tax=Drosophila hydei TaxID=7224 RepID=A0A6J1LEK3_DROHY|nr:uncharacterized protein LOC111595792 [Drosophila hydei]